LQSHILNQRVGQHPHKATSLPEKDCNALKESGDPLFFICLADQHTLSRQIIGNRLVLYWLLRTSVREKDTLGFHHHPLPRCQVRLSYRSRRGMVLMHKRKYTSMGSRPSGKAYTGCRRGLWQTASGTRLLAGWTSSTGWTLAHVVPFQAAQW
jgi:hypothetical protein